MSGDLEGEGYGGYCREGEEGEEEEEGEEWCHCHAVGWWCGWLVGWRRVLRWFGRNGR